MDSLAWFNATAMWAASKGGIECRQQAYLFNASSILSMNNCILEPKVNTGKKLAGAIVQAYVDKVWPISDLTFVMAWEAEKLLYSTSGTSSPASTHVMVFCNYDRITFYTESTATGNRNLRVAALMCFQG